MGYSGDLSCSGINFPPVPPAATRHLEKQIMAQNISSSYRSHGGSSRRKSSLSKQRRKLVITGYVFVLPAMVFFYGVRMIPMWFALYLSFTDWDILTPDKSLVGLDNYADALTNAIFLTSLRNTAYYTGTDRNRRHSTRPFSSNFSVQVSSFSISRSAVCFLYSTRDFYSRSHSDLGLDLPTHVWPFQFIP